MTSPRHHSKTDVAAPSDVPKHFRRLKAEELVRRGDFVVDGQKEFELWEGPTGFRADSFVKLIYRRQKQHFGKIEKSN